MLDLLRSVLQSFFGPSRSNDRRWTRINLPRDTWRFGGAAPSDMAAFLARPSTVRVSAVQEVCDWLRECAYEHDEVLFGEPDRWQAPAEFEARRRGDCEDHALWAWRKLHELGIEAELVVGRYLTAPGPHNYHAWVVYTEPSGRRMLLEATTKGWGRMPAPLEEVGHEYLPFHSIDGYLQTFTYGGYLLALERGDPFAR